MTASGAGKGEVAEGMNLTEDEANALARRVILDHCAIDNDWLQWDDYPNLGEFAFDRLHKAVADAVKNGHDAADEFDRDEDIDARDLLNRAQS